MATRRKVGNQQPRKAAAPPPEPIDDDLAVAEELLRLAREDSTRQPEPVDDDLAVAEELLRLAHEDQAVIDAEARKFRKALRQLGIRLPAKPIGAKKLRERLLKKGFDPESNEFSRGIIEMREE
jgi:hypothetical protein